MTKEEINKQIQKEIGGYLREFGFKKVKSRFHCQLPDSRVIVVIDKLSRFGDEEDIVWQMLWGVAYTLFDPIFRPERDISTITVGECDRGFGIDVRLEIPGYLLAPGLWRVTDKTDIAVFLGLFKNVCEPVWQKLLEPNGVASLKFNVTSCLELFDSLEQCSSGGLLKAAIAAKHWGMIGDYLLFLGAIKRHPHVNTEFMQRHLPRLDNEAAKADF
jgi:hypothetical protein